MVIDAIFIKAFTRDMNREDCLQTVCKVRLLLGVCKELKQLVLRMEQCPENWVVFALNSSDKLLELFVIIIFVALLKPVVCR
jgi:hypothetical protein